MRDHDTALDQAIQEVAALLGDALVRMTFPLPPTCPVDSSETESLHVNAG